MRFVPLSVFLLSSSMLLSACSTAKAERDTEQPQVNAPTTTAVVPVEAVKPIQPEGKWTDWEISPGVWTYRNDERGSIALFGRPGQDATIMLRCDDDRRQIFLSRIGQVRENAKMTLRASSGLQAFPVQNSGGATNYAAAIIPPNDISLDRIAYSRGRFAIEIDGLRSIAVPIWPEFTRVVEDCR